MSFPPAAADSLGDDMKKKLTRRLIKRAWTIGSAGDLDGWMDRFIDELAKQLGIEIEEGQ